MLEDLKEQYRLENPPFSGPYEPFDEWASRELKSNPKYMESARYTVVMRSGRKFMVEEWGTNHTQWGDIDPATKKLHKVKVKDVEVINESNTMITKENGFKNICFLAPGTSAIGYVDLLDSSGVERIESDLVKYVD